MDPQEMLYKMLPAWEGTGNASLLLHIIDQRVKAALQSQDTHAMFTTFFAEYFANREAEIKSDLPKIGGVTRLPSMPMVDAPAYKVMITARNGIELFTETVADGLSREDAESLADEVASEADIQISVSPSGVAPHPVAASKEQYFYVDDTGIQICNACNCQYDECHCVTIQTAVYAELRNSYETCLQQALGAFAAGDTESARAILEVAQTDLAVM